MDEKTIVDVISDYINDLQDPTTFYEHSKSFKMACYKEWATNELIRFLKLSDISIESIEIFRHTMEYYHEFKEKEQFLIAVNVANDILEILSVMEFSVSFDNVKKSLPSMEEEFL